MCLLRKITKRFEPVRMVDPLFGGVRFQKTGFWEGYVYFEPLGKQIEIAIDGGVNGPTEEQRGFYREFEGRYRGLSASIGNVLHDAFTNWKDEFPRGDIWDEFELEWISIPDIEPGELEWELSYSCASDGHSFDVRMIDWSPQDVAVNG